MSYGTMKPEALIRQQRCALVRPKKKVQWYLVVLRTLHSQKHAGPVILLCHFPIRSQEQLARWNYKAQKSERAAIHASHGHIGAAPGTSAVVSKLEKESGKENKRNVFHSTRYGRMFESRGYKNQRHTVKSNSIMNNTCNKNEYQSKTSKETSQKEIIGAVKNALLSCQESDRSLRQS